MLENTQITWQQILRESVTDLPELLSLLKLDAHAKSLCSERAVQAFSLKVPRGYLSRIEKGDIDDPLLKQILPLQEEMLQVPQFQRSPLQEENFNPLSGLLHKYQGRVLLTIATQCGVQCRFCFRRAFPYKENQPNRAQWQHVFDHIQADKSIREVIFSGGDPLMVGDDQLGFFISACEAISHVKRIRFHTRMPIVIPERVTHGLIHWLTKTRLHTVMVLHCNHAKEIDDQVVKRVALFREAGITLLNQAVLLKGINDNAKALVQLSETLFECGVLPYYLHLLDKVQGAAHFDVSREKAKELQDSLLKELPGYLVPKMVYEKPGANYKLPF